MVNNKSLVIYSLHRTFTMQDISPYTHTQHFSTACVFVVSGSRLKRIGFPLALTTAATAVCYPMYTVGALKVGSVTLPKHSHYLESGPVFDLTVPHSLKVTGKKVYAASSWVASVFKSKPKQDGLVPDVNLEVSDMYIRIQTCLGTGSVHN